VWEIIRPVIEGLSNYGVFDLLTLFDTESNRIRSQVRFVTRCDLMFAWRIVFLNLYQLKAFQFLLSDKIEYTRRAILIELSKWRPSTCTTDLDLQVDFQGHLKVKLIFLNRNSPWQDHSSKLRYTISNVKFPVLSESGVKNRGLMILKIWRSRSVVQVDGPHCLRQFLSEPCFCKWLIYRDIWVDRLKWSTVYIYLVYTRILSVSDHSYTLFKNEGNGYFEKCFRQKLLNIK